MWSPPPCPPKQLEDAKKVYCARLLTLFFLLYSLLPKIESCFLPLNPNVEFTPLAHTWGPLTHNHHDRPDPTSPPPPPPAQAEANTDDRPSPSVTFVDGLRTFGGHGDPTIKEGLAVHMYTFDADMTRQAFVNHDGEFLVVPQRGTLDIQTELGYLRVAPGDVAVLPPGFRLSVSLAGNGGSSAASGYVLEVFGTHFRLPELGPLGANGLAHVRDFAYPVASFDLDCDPSPDLTPLHGSSVLDPHPAGESSSSSSRRESGWEIVTKLGGKLSTYRQPHTPFDVVAWHGRYAPYKYALAHFGHLTANTDQLDPTAYCVLTAPSKWPGVSLVDFCVFGEKYAVARDALRIPYHHRTVATELVGIVRGRYGGSVRPLEAGGLSFEQGYMPHGETYECWRRESERVLGVDVVGKDFLGALSTTLLEVE